MAKGYTSKFMKIVEDADPSKLGVQLGQVCIKNDIPVNDVAQFLGVTRMTVYSWFTGKTNVSKTHHDKMSKLVEKLQ